MLTRMLLFVAHGVHGYFTVESWRTVGYGGFFPPFADANTSQIFSDLLISISLVHVAIAKDLFDRGDAPILNLPLLLGTFLSGSFCPMLYFLMRPEFVDKVLFRRKSSGA